MKTFKITCVAGTSRHDEKTFILTIQALNFEQAAIKAERIETARMVTVTNIKLDKPVVWS